MKKKHKETLSHMAFAPKGYIPKREYEAFLARHLDHLVVVTKEGRYIEKLEAYDIGEPPDLSAITGSAK